MKTFKVFFPETLKTIEVKADKIRNMDCRVVLLQKESTDDGAPDPGYIIVGSFSSNCSVYSEE
jgi:hypothetical protein